MDPAWLLLLSQFYIIIYYYYVYLLCYLCYRTVINIVSSTLKKTELYWINSGCIPTNTVRSLSVGQH